MKVAHLPEPAEDRVVFRDGLGVRERRDSGTGELVEWFFLDPAFATVEGPLRERVSRLANLQHVKFARIRTLEPASKGKGPVLVSSHVTGSRLSDVLEMGGHGLITLDAGAALQVTREVLAALSVLHDSRNVTHGSLAPERIVLAPTGRVVVVEHVLAHALDRMHLPRHQLWRDWRIATPPAAGPVRFDVRTDLAQAGLVILALLLGRPLDAEEYPHRLRGLLPIVQDRLGRSPAAALAADMVGWLERLMPVDSRRAFTTVREAQHAYEALVSGRASAAGIAPARVKAVLLAMAALEISTTAASPAAAEIPADAPAPILAVVARGAPAPDPPVGEARDSDPAAQPALEAPLAASSDDEVDIEALLRLEDELEAAAGMPVGDVVTMPALCAPPVPPSRRRTSRREATPEPDAADAPEPPSLATLQQERAHLERHFADIVAAIAPIDVQPAHPVSAHPEGAERSAAHSATAHETAHETAREIAVDSPAEVVAVEAPALPVEPEVIRLVPEVPATGGPLIDEIVRWRSMPIDEPSPIAATPIDELARDESAPTGVAAGLVDGDAPSACWWADALPWRAERAEDTSPPTAAEVSLSSAEVDVDSALTTEMWPIEVAAHVIEPDPWTGSEFGTAQVTTIPEGADSGASPIDDATASRAEAEIDVEPRLTAAALELEVADCISFGEDAAETTVSIATDGASAASDMEDVADVAGCTRLIETVDVIDAAAVEAPDDVVPMIAAPLDEVVEVVAEPDAVLEEVGGLELVLEAQSVAALDLQDAVDDVVEPEPFSLQAEPAVTQSMLNLTAIDDALPDAEGAVSAPSFDWSAAEPLDGNHPRVVAERDASVEPEVYGHLNVETAAAAGDKTAAVTPEVIVVDDPIEDDAFRKLLSESPDQADAPTAETAAAEPHQLELEQDLVVDPTIVEAIAQPESGALDAWVGTYSEVEVVATVPVAAVDDLPVASSEGVHGGDVDEPDARAATLAPLHVPFEEVSGFDADERDAHPLEVDADGLSAEEPVVVEHEPEPTWSSGEPVAPVIELVADPAIEPVLELSAEPVAIEAPEVEDAEDTDAEAEAGRVAEPEPVLELEAELVAEPAAEVEAELEAEAEADAEVEHEAHPDLDLEPEPEPEAEAEVEVQADGDVDREVVEGSMAPAHGAAASAVTPAPPERKKRRRSRRKRGAVTTPLPVPARLPVAPTVPPPAATPLLAPPEPVTRSPASPSATMIEGSAVGEPQVAQEERASAAVRPTRSLVDREVPAWTPPLNLSSIRECPPLPVEPLPPAADVADAPTRDLPAGTQASPAWSPQGSSLLLPEPARPGEIEIRAVGMPDLAEYVPRPSHPALTTMADATASTASHARQAPTDGWHPPVPATPDRRSVNWRRLIAASILLALLQGVAFAAWWWAQPGVHGTLVVQTAVDGVDILIDGAVVGRTPFRGQVSPGRHKLTLRHGDRRRDMPVEISLGVVTTQALDWPEAAANATGSLQVTSTPTGAEVLVRGVAKGKAPLLLEDLPAGPQPITLRGESGTVTVTATVRPGETIQLDVPIFAGWVVVDSPVELSLLLNGTRIGSNMDGQILLSPGSHRLEAVSEALGFRQRFTVTVEPGEVKRVTVRLPTAALQVQDDDGAEVYVDGDRVGALPGNLRIPLGTHDVVIRRRDGGERRQTVTVRAGDTVTIP